MAQIIDINTHHSAFLATVIYDGAACGREDEPRELHRSYWTSREEARAAASAPGLPDMALRTLSRRTAECCYGSEIEGTGEAC